MITVRTSPAYVNRVRQDWTANGGVYGDGGVYALVPSNDPFAQLGPTLDLTFAGNPTDLLTASTTAGYTLDTYFTPETYQIAVPYAIWEDGVGLSQKTFSQIVTFTRASTATYFNSAGTLTSAAVDEARFDYDPSTLAAQGLLIEEARTNLSTNSVLASAWGAGTNASYVDTQALSPDGTNTAWSLVENSANASHFGSLVNILTTYTSGITYTISRFLKASGRNVVTVYLPATNFATPGRVAFFNLTTGVVVSTEAGVTATIQNVGNGWYRCSASAVAIATGSGHVGGSALTDNGTEVYQGNGVSGALVWGHQLEAGAFPTSYIPTTTTALTRAADVASVNTLSPWFNATAGTLYAEWVARLGVDQQAFGLVNNVGDGVRVRKSSPNNYLFVARDPVVRDITLVPSPAITEGQIIKVAGAYAINDLALSGGGQSPATGSTYSVVTATTAFIGGSVSAGATYVNGHLRRITYYPRRLSNADLQTITT